MSEDKRKGDKPVPDNAKEFLNDAQLAVLGRLEGFGWKIKYIRRPLFLKPVIVVTDADGGSVGVLEDDGRLNLESDIVTSRK